MLYQIKKQYCLNYLALFSLATLLTTLTAILFLLGTVAKSQNPSSLQTNAAWRDGGLDTSFHAVLSQTRFSPGTSQAYPLPDGKILVAGGFKVVNGFIKINLAKLNTDGTLDNSFGVTLGSTSSISPTTIINQILVQPDSKILIAGSFNMVNNVAANNFARLNPDGTLDTTLNIGSGFNNSVSAVALQANGQILVGGGFTSYNGVSRTYLVRLNVDGSLDASLNATIVSFSSTPIGTILPLPDGKIFLHGSFSTINGILRRGLAKLNSDGTLDSSFVEPGTYSLFNGMGAFVIRPDGKIYISGFFEIRINNQLVCQNLCLINENGMLNTSYFVSFGTNSSVSRMRLQPDGRLLIAGSFETVNGISRNDVTRLNADGSLDVSFNPNFNIGDGIIASFVPLSDGSYLLPGVFTVINGTTVENLAKINTSGDIDTSFAPRLAAIAYFSTASAIQADGKILVAGNFNRANGVLRGRIARFNPDGTLDTSFNATITNGQPGTIGFEDVNKIVLQPDGKILIGGQFAQVNGETHNFLARINSDGSVDSGFNPIITYQGSGGGSITSIALQSDGKIIIGGAFQTVNGTSRVRYARLNSDGSLDGNFVIPFDQSSTSYVNAISAQPDGKILIGGDFKFIGNSSVFSVTRLNADGSLDASFIPSSAATATPYYVRSIARQPDGKILLGGTWSSLNRPLLSRLNADGSADTTFTPGRIGIGFSSDSIHSIIVQPNGKIFIAGYFSNINNNPRAIVARLIENGGLDFSFNAPSFRAENPSNSTTVFSLNQTADGNLIVAGYFDRIGNNFASGLARLQVNNISHQPLFDYDGDGKTDISIFRPSSGQWWYQQSTNNVTKAFTFGTSSDQIAPADYDGDGRTDIAFWRPSTGEWFVLKSSNLTFFAAPFGVSTDVPAPGDFDGDSKADFAVFRPGEGVWFINMTSGGVQIIPFGIGGDIPVVSDYDGDGKSDIGVYRPSGGSGQAEWWIMRSSAGLFATPFGTSGDKPVPGDYTGDGKADAAFWRASTGEWYVLRSEDLTFYAAPFGSITDIPVLGDYDGDEKNDLGVFRPDSATWFVLKSGGGILIQGFGTNGDRPVPSAFIP